MMPLTEMTTSGTTVHETIEDNATIISSSDMKKEEETCRCKRRENVSLMKCPAGLRKVANRKALGNGARAEISVSAFVAKEPCMKCPNGKKNREKIFRKDDKVLIVNTFNGDFSTRNGEQSYSSKDVWVLVETTKKMWMRPLNTVIDKLDFVDTKKVAATVSMAGNVGEVAKRASEKVKQVECYYVSFDGFDANNGIWFETGFFHKEDRENYVMDITSSDFSPFENEETVPGPEATFMPS